MRMLVVPQTTLSMNLRAVIKMKVDSQREHLAFNYVMRGLKNPECN